MAWDATCPDTFAATNMHLSCRVAGAAAIEAESRKCAKYRLLDHSIEFQPVAVETMGSWGATGLALVNEIGRRAAVEKCEPRAAAYLHQRISMAIQRGNACCIRATHPVTPLPPRPGIC